MSGRVIETYFDYGSPYCYFVVDRLEAVAKRNGATVDWRPIDLQRLFEARWPYSDAKRRYVFTDALRSAEFYGVETRMPEPLPVRGALAARVALSAQAAGIFDVYNRRVFRAAWAESRDIGDEAVLAACILDAGRDPAALLAEAKTESVADRVRALTAQAEARGVFGVPAMFLDDELFWGNDRVEMLEWRLRGGNR